MHIGISKDEAQAQVSKLAAFIQELFHDSEAQREFVVLSLTDKAGCNARDRMLHASIEMGLDIDLIIEDLNPYINAPKELVLAAYAKIVTDTNGSMLDFVAEAKKMGVDLSTEAVFRVIDPVPTEQRKRAQYGVHLEEFSEMLDECKSDNEGLTAKMALANTLLKEIALEFKSGKAALIVTNRDKFGDALQDQVVTAKGVGHTQGYKMAENEARVSVANMTKNFDAVPSWLPGGKWAKGPYFVAPVTAE